MNNELKLKTYPGGMQRIYVFSKTESDIGTIESFQVKLNLNTLHHFIPKYSKTAIFEIKIVFRRFNN